MTMRSFVLLFTVWASADADKLILRNGTRVPGRWWATDDKAISFLVNDRLEWYSRPDVSEVIFGDGPNATPTQSLAAPVPATAPSPAGSTRSAEMIVRKPDQIGAIYLQEDSGNLLPVERTEAVAHPGSAGPRARRSNGQYWEIPGERAPFRLTSGSRTQFVVEMPAGIAPGTFSLYPLESTGYTRRTKAGTGNGPAVTIPLAVTKVEGNTYVLAPAKTLAPGEYSFSPAGSNDAYCFGIDPAVPGAR
jgi:hypothetical protein